MRKQTRKLLTCGGILAGVWYFFFRKPKVTAPATMTATQVDAAMEQLAADHAAGAITDAEFEQGLAALEAVQVI